MPDVLSIVDASAVYATLNEGNKCCWHGGKWAISIWLIHWMLYCIVYQDILIHWIGCCQHRESMGGLAKQWICHLIYANWGTNNLLALLNHPRHNAFQSNWPECSGYNGWLKYRGNRAWIWQQGWAALESPERKPDNSSPVMRGWGGYNLYFMWVMIFLCH